MMLLTMLYASQSILSAHKATIQLEGQLYKTFYNNNAYYFSGMLQSFSTKRI